MELTKEQYLRKGIQGQLVDNCHVVFRSRRDDGRLVIGFTTLPSPPADRPASGGYGLIDNTPPSGQVYGLAVLPEDAEHNCYKTLLTCARFWFSQIAMWDYTRLAVFGPDVPLPQGYGFHDVTDRIIYKMKPKTGVQDDQPQPVQPDSEKQANA